MALTEFLQVKDNAKTLAPLGSLANITASLTVNGIDTSSFPAVTTGYIVTIWNDVAYPDPGDDPNMEKATVTAATIAENGSFTLNRQSPKVHVGTPRVALLLIAQHISDLENAVASLSQGIYADANGVLWQQSVSTTGAVVMTTVTAPGSGFLLY